jgi:hypothetical protein
MCVIRGGNVAYRYSRVLKQQYSDKIRIYSVTSENNQNFICILAGIIGRPACLADIHGHA